jgi:hypothetical protein
VFGRVAQLATPETGCPLNGTGFGDTVTCTFPLAPTGAGWFGAGTGVGVGVGEGLGVGLGVGLGAGAVPGLLDRDGTPPATGVGVVGDDGSTEPQPLAAIAKATMTNNGARMVSPPCLPSFSLREAAITQDAHPACGSGGEVAAMPLVAANSAPAVQHQQTHCEKNSLISWRINMWMVVVALLACFASTAAAQTAVPADQNRGNITLSASYDFTNAYMFRGLRQDDTRLIMWPSTDAGIRLHANRNGATDAAIHIGSWNSLHTGVTGSQGPTGRLWYESDFYATLALTLVPGVDLGTTYTAYTSPNSSFSTVKELSFKVAANDFDAPAGVVLHPYALVAFELDTAPGVGQADGGPNGGTYLELGVAPGFADPPFAITFPIKVGLSLNHYYELAGVDHQFGFLSLGAMASIPLARSNSYGTWNVHGGFEFLSLGDTPEAFNAGEQQKLVGSIGIGFSY